MFLTHYRYLLTQKYIQMVHSVIISGNIKDFDSTSSHGLTFLIISPDQNIVTIGQILQILMVHFKKSFVAGGQIMESQVEIMLLNLHYGPT